MPAAAFNMISRALAADAEAAAAAAAASRKAREQAAEASRGLRVKYVWHGRSAETVLPFVELNSFESVGKLVGDLARRGNAIFSPERPQETETAAPLIKPSVMRIEYKVADKKTGVMQRVQLTPQSQLQDLQKAESILIKPHDELKQVGS